MKKRNRALASATVLSLVLTSTVTATNVQAAAEVTRVQGAERENTAMEVAKQVFGTAETVVLVNGYGYADAVSATPLAKALNAPILLTNKVDAPTAELTATLTKLGAKNVVIVGGTGAVTPAMETALKANYGVTRIGGASRYETNAEVAKAVLAKTGAKGGVLVSAEGYADALSVASIAAAKGMPVLFGNKNEVPAAVKTVAAGLEVVAVGGEAVLPASVLEAVKATRVASGATRFETNLAVLEHFKADLKLENIYVAAGGATATGFADALVASAAAAKVGAPVVLTGAGANDKAIKNANDYIAKNLGENTKVTVIGGKGSVSESIFDDLKEIANPDEHKDEKLSVKSVTSLNAAQVKVEFNRNLTEDEKDEAEDLGNYTLENTKDDEIDDVFADVEVEDDSNVAILTVDHSKLGDDDDEYQNQATYKLVLDENIIGEEVTKEFKVSDYDIPEVKSAEVVGIRTIKVKVSEPIVAKANKDLEDAFEINDGDYSIDKVKSFHNGTELNIELSSDLKDGEELTIETKTEAEDYAGYALKKATLKTSVKFDKSDLKVESFKKAKDREVTLVFNKDVIFSDYEDDTKLVSDDAKSDTKYKDFKSINDDDFFENFYHTTSKNKAEAIEIDGNEVTLYFGSDYQLPETAYVFVDSDTLEDLWEKKNNDLNVKVNIVKDNARPEIKKIEQDEDSNKKIVITFNEDIDKESAEEKSNYTIKDKDGKEVRVSAAKVTDDDEVTLDVSKELEDGDKYDVTVEDVEDLAGNKITKVTKQFTAQETQAVEKGDITVNYYDEGKSSQKIVVDFDTKMLADGSRYAINNLDNYDLTIVGKKTINLSDYDGASIKAVDGDKKVEIKLPGNSPDNDDRFDFTKADLKLTINKVQDANENKTDIFADIKINPAGTIGLDDAKKSPIAKDLETVEVVFEDELDFESKDVKLGYEVNGKWVDINTSSPKVEKKDGVTTVKYTLKEADQLAFNGKYDGKYDVIVKTVEKPESENRYGDTLAGDQKWTVMDEINPELAIIDAEKSADLKTDIALDDRDDYDDAVKVISYDKATYTATVQLIFEEDLTDANINKYAFKTDDSDVDVTNAELKGNVITLTLDAKDAKEDYTDIKDFLGLGITTGTNELFDTATNSPDGANGAKIDTEIEIVDTAAADKAAADKAAADKIAAAEKAATDAVVKAEGSKTQADVDAAKELVNALTAGTVKTDLLDRITKIVVPAPVVPVIPVAPVEPAPVAPVEPAPGV